MKKIIIILLLFYVGKNHAQQTVGLFLNEAEAFQGYTLFGNNEITYLIDNCGLIVNSWTSDYKPGESKYLLENGNLLQAVRIDGSFSAGGVGGRFELWSWEGELLWAYEYAQSDLHAHHDIAPLPNGNFLFTAWEKHSQESAKLAGRVFDGEVWSEKIVEIEMLGNNQANIVWEWRLWDHLVQDIDPAKDNYGIIADHPELVNINYIGTEGETSGNWIHLNAIDYHPELDQIVVSARLFNEVWIIDHSTTSEQAASHEGGQSGKGGDLLYRFGNPETYNKGNAGDQVFFSQHDVRWIPDGHPHAGKLMVFNNEYLNNQSSVEIWSTPIGNDGLYLLNEQGVFDPDATDQTFTLADFYSNLMSGAQMLPNGNILICEGMSGHFFEVNREEEIVWEYVNPVNRNGGPAVQGGTVRFNQTFRATRYAPDYPAFSNKDMTGQLPVEINPWESECFIPDNTQIPEPEIKILNNPFRDLLILESNQAGDIPIVVFNVQGRLIMQSEITSGSNHFDMSGFSPGIYIVRFLNEGFEIPAAKIVKF